MLSYHKGSISCASTHVSITVGHKMSTNWELCSKV